MGIILNTRPVRLLTFPGLERTDNNMEFSTWPQVAAINQKNYYTDYLKRDDQILAYRLQQELARDRMTKAAKDRDRALAQGRPIGPDGEVLMDEEDEEEAEDEAHSGSKTLVIHLGSQNMRIGLASDGLPKTVPMVIAKKAVKSESEEGDGEPKPKRIKLDSGNVPVEAEKWFGEDFTKEYNKMTNELQVRMRFNKRRVLPQSKVMVTSYNKRTEPDVITEHNDPMRIDWTELPADPNAAPEYIVGKEALRIPDNSVPRYKLHWPMRCGWINEQDYDSRRFLYQDIQLIIEEAAKSQLQLPIRSRKDWAQYSCVFIIPDLYDKTFVSSLLNMGLSDFGFARVCFQQESLAASFGANYTSTCIVDMGAQKTSIACVEDGMILENSRVNLKYGGQDVTDTFIKMLLFDWFPYADLNLRRRYDFMLAEELKQRFCTMNEADVSVQLFDFHLRASGQDTRKYTFKAYDEPILAPMGFFRPSVFDHEGKLSSRRRLVTRSADIYDGKPNDPTSQAQAQILNDIAPAAALAPVTNGANGSESTPTNGVNGHAKPGSKGDIEMTEAPHPTSLKPFSRLQDNEATPRSSIAGSPVRDLEATPQPGAKDDVDSEKSDEPISIERRDDILPVYPLPKAILTSINHAAKGSASRTKDFFGGIMLIGGSSQIPGMAGYLEESLQVLEPSYANAFLIGRPPRELDPQVVCWKGGSVFGRMARTNDSWIGAMEYERLGERILAYKCMWAF